MKKEENILRQVRRILKTPEAYPITKRAKEIMSGIKNIHRLYKVSLTLRPNANETSEWLNGYNKAVVDILTGFK